MFQLDIDKSQNVVRMVFSQHVTLQETRSWRERLGVLVTELSPGFKLLSDLSDLEMMDPECAAEIEFGMDLCNQAGVAKVVRVIPDPKKDIGLSIMSVFHYRRNVRIVTCATLAEALQALAD